jgi:hypothetical protein
MWLCNVVYFSVLKCICSCNPQVFQAYCEKKSIEQNTVKFLFDGQRVQAEDTPETVGSYY